MRVRAPGAKKLFQACAWYVSLYTQQNPLGHPLSAAAQQGWALLRCGQERVAGWASLGVQAHLPGAGLEELFAAGRTRMCFGPLICGRHTASSGRDAAQSLVQGIIRH